jgi:cysteinyl-tRNA synthetase
VTFVQNYTDIDDKILARAAAEGSSMEAVSERNIEAFVADMAALNILPADRMPRATRSLEPIRQMIGELEAKGAAYSADGDVYFAVMKHAGYGKLSGRDLAEQQQNADGRVSGSEEARKHHPFDFALWKAAKPGEPAWDSPWGEGRPGWHIECSAMVRDYLGPTIDLHVGGSDLIFPHHENEIAQSEAATGQPLANYWLHNGMVRVEGEKMSKSLGNFTTIRELLAQIDPMAVRLFVLQGHYRKPLDFTQEALQAATNGWQTLREGLAFGYSYGSRFGWDLDFSPLTPLANDWTQRFEAAVNDDFNFAEGLAILFELAKDLRKEGNVLVHQGQTETDPAQLQLPWQTLVTLAGVLGLAIAPISEESVTENNLSDQEIEQFIQQRTIARKNKDFAESDRLRDQLKELGITLIDQPGGVTKWHR